MQLSGDLTAIIAMILLPVGILMCGYALAMFVLRAGDITNKTNRLIEDRRWVAGEAAPRARRRPPELRADCHVPSSGLLLHGRHGGG